MSLLGVVGVVLIILKLAGLIALSWLWVLAPFWIIPIIWIVFIFFGACFVASADRAIHRKRRW